MKTRIKIVEKNSGERVYIPQTESDVFYNPFWHLLSLIFTFRPMPRWKNILVSKEHEVYVPYWEDEAVTTCKTLEGAEDVLHRLREKEKKEEEERLLRIKRENLEKIHKITYIKY